jgi:hypothetical protein
MMLTLVAGDGADVKVCAEAEAVSARANVRVLTAIRYLFNKPLIIISPSFDMVKHLLGTLETAGLTYGSAMSRGGVYRAAHALITSSL